jgi:hypothetical protein
MLLAPLSPKPPPKEDAMPVGKKDSSGAGAPSAGTGSGEVLQSLALPWRRAGRADDHITDEIDFSPNGSATYRHILDNNDELVAIVCVESIDDEAAADLKRRVSLLLAAPHMLEVLKAIGSDTTSKLMDRIEAVIAKATS